MNINPFEIVETNGKRLKTGLLLIFNRVDKNNIVDIYAMRIYNCYRKPQKCTINKEIWLLNKIDIN